MHAVNQVVSQTRDIKILHNKCDIKTILKRVNKGWQHYGTEMKAIISWLLHSMFPSLQAYLLIKIISCTTRKIHHKNYWTQQQKSNFLTNI